MKTSLALILICLGLIPFSSAALEELAKEGHVLIGKDEGETVTVKMVRIGPKSGGEILLQVTGVEADFNGKVERCKKTPTGLTFTYVCGKRNRLRDNELYAGGKSIFVYEDEKLSSAFKTDEFLAQYLKKAKP